MESQITLNPEERVVVIVGLAGAGKTTIAQQLHQHYPEFKLFSTDDYINKGYGLQVIMNDVVYFDQSKRKLIEGVQCFHMLKEGLESKTFYPDVVVNVLATEEVRYGRRPGKNYKQMDAALRLVWMRYNRMPNDHPPRLIELFLE